MVILGGYFHCMEVFSGGTVASLVVVQPKEINHLYNIIALVLRNTYLKFIII